jgi:hypothetical protein
MKLVDIGRQTPWAVVFLVLLAITLAVLPLLLLPDSLPDEQTTLASVGSIVLLVFALLTLVRDSFSVSQVVAALCVLLVLVTGGLLAWRIADQWRALTVTEDVDLTGAKSLQTDETAVLTLRAPAQRDELRLVFEADDRGIGSPCEPSSSLWLTGGALQEAREAEFGREVRIPLVASDKVIRLKAELGAETDSECVLSVRTKRAVLDND